MAAITICSDFGAPQNKVLEGGKTNSFWYGDHMQTLNDFSWYLILYNTLYVFWALIFSFGNLA